MSIQQAVGVQATTRRGQRRVPPHTCASGRKSCGRVRLRWKEPPGISLEGPRRAPTQELEVPQWSGPVGQITGDQPKNWRATLQGPQVTLKLALDDDLSELRRRTSPFSSDRLVSYARRTAPPQRRVRHRQGLRRLIFRVVVGVLVFLVHTFFFSSSSCSLCLSMYIRLGS